VKEPDWRYLAGLWDGEGSVTVSSQKRTRGWYWQVRLNITNTSARLIRSVHEEFGGRIWMGKLRADACKPQYQWVVFNSKECLYILQNILPYLRYKDDEAKLAIEYFEGMSVDKGFSGKRLPAEEIERRNRIVSSIRRVDGRRKQIVYMCAAMESK
jgi:hypothetical protein